MIKILVPVDGSAGSDKAVRFAMFLAEAKDSEIIVLNVQPSYNTFNVKLMFSQEQIRAFQDESSREIFNHIRAITNSSPVPVHTVLRTGDPGKEICAEAQENRADIIVMGYRGLGAVKRAILGSVANHVLHDTPCPLTIVP
ncbi:MAG: universal stress protein [Syntrophomonadaceae bacterium]|nr:universal stress protein [Syntrophomonadaceae bacterium]